MPDAWGSVAKGLAESTLDVLWRQWSALGATAATPPAGAIVDPEALILMSLFMRNREYRLADAIESWMAVNSPLLSVQRLKNLRGAFSGGATSLIPAVASIAVRNKDLRWKSLLAEGSPPLGERANKVRASRPLFGVSGALMLQLRSGMGVGVKADIIAYLLGVWDQGRTWAGVSAIAEETCYTRAAVRRAADDLADAKFIKSLDSVRSRSGDQRMYSAEPPAWGGILNLNTQPFWRSWHQRFAFISHALDQWASLTQRGASDYARSAAARDLLERFRHSLQQWQVFDDERFADITDWESALREALGQTREWLLRSA